MTRNHFGITIRILLFAQVLFLMSCTPQAKDVQSGDQINQGFITPPPAARPGAFWCWLNGNMSRESITRDLEQMKDKGMSRAEIWDVAAAQNANNFIPAGGAFLGDESVALIKHAIAEGKRLEMKIGIIGSSGWNAGGSWVTPDWASKSLYFSEVVVDGPQLKTIELPFPVFPADCPMKDAVTPVFYKDIAILGIPSNDSKTLDNTSQVVDLTPDFKNGKLTWEVPPGKWTIIRFVCSNNGQRLIVPSPNSDGLFIDFLDPKATKRHLKYFMDRLGVTPANSAEAGLAYLEFDSMEMAEGTPWTDSLSQIFKDKQGYDLEKYLPVFAGWKIRDQSDRFLYDFKKVISDQLIYSHYTTGTEFLKLYNAELVAESGGPGPPVWETCPVDALKALGSVTTPRGEFWIMHRNMFLIKEVSSAAHIYGKQRVDAESFTTWRRWKDSPFEMKKYVDRAYCEGLNEVTFHTFASTNPEDGLPGRTYHAGSDINPGTTWWEKARPFMDYLARCNFMLRQGLFVADVCYYYGDQAPNFFPLFHDVPQKPRLYGLGNEYDYDVINTDVILHRLSVKDGRLVLPDGMSYALMLLPDQQDMPLEVLQRIEQLVNEGATIIGRKPSAVPGLWNRDEDQTALTDIAQKMWGSTDDKGVINNKYGKGKVISGLTAGEVLQQNGVPGDFSFSGDQEIDFIHRTTDMGEIYFLRNSGEEPVKSNCTFRVTDRFPELWDATTGSMARIENFKSNNLTTTVGLELAAHGSAFVVFNKKHRKDLQVMAIGDIQETSHEITGPWNVNFPAGWGAPSSATFNTLISWTESADEGIKYFSGTAIYTHSFALDKSAVGKPVILDLGEMRDVAEVFINGKSSGILWRKPFTTDITALVKEGENDLKIEVVNMWINRITGDMQLDPKDRFCRTNKTYMTREVWPGGDEPFRIQTAGLLGPVRLIY